ncbi:hypothetical protein [Paenibacillus faecalis]|uniref:hypothetical protein n=1 Tax=Paenibacillus faecalis TaxID=2079532 RepID=UPI000D10AC78|nr:hypothetical protein [Paenibacillus faecalis]
MLNIHDNEIVSYEVDFQKSRIKLHTVGDTQVTIEFIDVLTHMFETQLQGSIILDISTFEVSRILLDNKELLEKQKNYGWPMYYETVEDLLEYLQNEKYNYYVILSSYGLNGWVISKEFKIYG